MEAIRQTFDAALAEYRRIECEHEAGRATEADVMAAFWTYEEARCALVRAELDEKRAKYGHNPCKPRWVPEISEWV